MNNQITQSPSDPPSDVIMTDVSSPIQTQFPKFLKYLSTHTVYEAIPENMKILVFNSELAIKECISAMANEDIYCSFIWDSNLGKYIGLMTIRDIVTLMKFIYEKMKNYKGPIVNINYFVKEMFGIDQHIDSLEVIKEDKSDIKTNSECQSSKSNAMEVDEVASVDNEENENDYKEFFKALNNITINDYITNVKTNNNLVSISLDGSLEECIKLIAKNSIHRLIIEDPKTKNYTGFITLETIFQFFIENYTLDIGEFDIKIKDLSSSMISKNLLKFNKNEKIYTIFEKSLYHKMSIMPIYDLDDNKNELFGFLYLKDVMYFFTNGNIFSFNDTVEKFLQKLYEGIDEEKPLGKERISIIDLEKSDYDLKTIFEMMSISPERKIIVKDKNDLGLITLSSIFKSVINYK